MPMNELQVLMATLLDASSVNATDYGIETADELVITRRQKRPHILLQQTDLPNGAYSCFYTAPFRCAADAHELTQDERKIALQAWKDGWDQLVKDGKFTPGVGGRMADGVDYARRAWNSAFPDKKVRSYRGTFPNTGNWTPGESATYQAMFNGWMMTIGRYSSEDLQEDLLDDGIIQNDAKASGNGVYGHLTCGIEANKVEDMKIMDNYPKWTKLSDGRTWKNTYVLDDIRKKRENGQIFPSTYIFLPA